MRLWGVVVLLGLSVQGGCLSHSPSHGGEDTAPQTLVRELELFGICFSDPEISNPPVEVAQRVEAQTQHLQIDREWIRALVTHESGGDPAAVSATGCTGLFAISPKHLPGRPCCVPEPEDESEYIYDVCNAERVSGFHCDRERDARFLPKVSFEVAGRLLEEFHSLNKAVRVPATSGPAGSRFALPIFWNAGPNVVVSFPSDMNTIGGVFSRVDFRKDPDYHRWKIRGLSNKWIEMFDYLRWFEYLTAFWSQREMAQRTPQAVPLPKFNCGIYDPDAVIGGSRIYFGLSFQKQAQVELAFQKVRMKRLRFGEYQNEFAFLGGRAELESVFASELAQEKRITSPHLNKTSEQ